MSKIDELIFGSAESWAKGKNLSLLVQPSYDAVARVNELAEQKKEVAALIHITCCLGLYLNSRFPLVTNIMASIPGIPKATLTATNEGVQKL